MSFWMHHSSEYEDNNKFYRGKVESAALTTVVLLIPSSVIAVLFVLLFFKFLAGDKELYLWTFVVLDVIAFVLLSARVELFRKLYEGFRMRETVQSAIKHSVDASSFRLGFCCTLLFI